MTSIDTPMAADSLRCAGGANAEPDTDAGRTPRPLRAPFRRREVEAGHPERGRPCLAFCAPAEAQERAGVSRAREADGAASAESRKACRATWHIRHLRR